ncbi:MAG: transposase [Aquabacterium sp.]|nr:transposase [Aquabacterium sp.]
MQLHGWSKRHRVVILRQRIRGGIARERRVDGKQLRLDLAGPSVHEGDKLWEYAVLVTDVAYPLESIGQLYRDRADAENAFDELKNQWGLDGFTTQDINRCQTVARACALVYNWWSWYCTAAHPTGRLEAITSRPLLLAAVGKAASHANQTTLYRTPMHGRADVLRKLIANIGTALQHVKAAAEQFKDIDRWGCLLRYISDRIAPVIRSPKPGQGLPLTGQLPDLGSVRTMNSHALLIMAIPAGGAVSGGALAALWKPSHQVRSLIQHFAAGGILAALAVKRCRTSARSTPPSKWCRAPSRRAASSCTRSSCGPHDWRATAAVLRRGLLWVCWWPPSWMSLPTASSSAHALRRGVRPAPCWHLACRSSCSSSAWPWHPIASPVGASWV